MLVFTTLTSFRQDHLVHKTSKNHRFFHISCWTYSRTFSVRICTGVSFSFWNTVQLYRRRVKYLMHGGASTSGVRQLNAGVGLDEELGDVVGASLAGQQQRRVVVRVASVWICTRLQQHLQSVKDTPAGYLALEQRSSRSRPQRRQLWSSVEDEAFSSVLGAPSASVTLCDNAL